MDCLKDSEVIRSSPWPLQRNNKETGAWLIRLSDGNGCSLVAAWPSGKAEDCNFIPSSNLVTLHLMKIRKGPLNGVLFLHAMETSPDLVFKMSLIWDCFVFLRRGGVKGHWSPIGSGVPL